MDPENTVIQISLFDWQQLKQEVENLRERVSKLESRNNMEVIKQDFQRFFAQQEQHKKVVPSE
jgi:hypothetical protein